VPPTFSVFMRGYKKTDVDRLVEQTEAALRSDDRAVRATAAARLRDCQLRVQMRGYSHVEVDAYIRDCLTALG
jgi:cell division septum initiation protein DivIVA